ncbi:alpha carbonic anhydrase 7 [Arachis ipaensis]|uniref:alpha carbonic anhydrase 7 n=1 Tax=Arachis ipaensis TaxID=130454 RepID=UPI0007AF707D|nr:alpha carbonic anhydrase 7 [Arachis ipaensis]XP_025641005.1 alpha carbonic anhydrase 7 [Arachis hypogaea]QHN98657.1 Alpha carbonic anhydrase [Arachis hypogaea]
MEKFSAKVFICSLFAAFVLLSSPARSQEVEDESEFNYDDEDSDRGPSHWGDIKAEWRMCKTGRMQSPIDLNYRSLQLARIGPFNLNYYSSNAILKNRGHDIELEILDPTSSLQINGSRYILKQLHWHSPSEHIIDGRRLDLEVHLVHQTPTTNQIAVIGILYRIGLRSDPLLSLLEGDLKALSGSSVGANRSVSVFDPREVDMDSNLYYRYMGSLTTPPCTENVTWTVLTRIKSVRREQINLFRDAVHDDSDGNARPIQPSSMAVQFNVDFSD